MAAGTSGESEQKITVSSSVGALECSLRWSQGVVVK